MTDQDTNLQDLLERNRAQEAGEQFIAAALKAAINQESEMAKEGEAPKVKDAEHIVDLLDIVVGTKDMSSLSSINQAAQAELAEINQELWRELYPEQAEAQDKAQEEREKAEAERQKQLEEERRREREKKERAA